MKCPNLIEIINYHPYHVSTFADFANVTGELLQRVLMGQEELLPKELHSISKYTGIPMFILECPKLIMLDNRRYRHQTMIKELLEKLKHIEWYQNNGNHAADVFMQYDIKYLEELELFFLEGIATYGQYIGARERVNDCFLFIHNERNVKRARTLKEMTAV